MVDFIITSGQHRDEKSAEVLAPLVTSSLKDLGYKFLLLNNPEKRTLLELAEEAYQEGRRIKAREVYNYLWGWEMEELPARYPKLPFFRFHNLGINPNNLIPWEEDYAALKADLSPNMAFGEFKRDRLASKLRYSHVKNDTLIEIPHITEIGRTEEEIKKLKKVFHHKTFEFYCAYFLSTDVEKTKKAGLMGKGIVKRLAYGIDYLLSNNLFRE